MGPFVWSDFQIVMKMFDHIGLLRWEPSFSQGTSQEQPCTRHDTLVLSVFFLPPRYGNDS